MKKAADILMIVLFSLVIFSVPVFTLSQEPEIYSIFENRQLAQAPKFTKADLLSGKYFKNWDTYFTDQMIGRNTLLSAYTDLQMKVLHKPVVSDVIIQGDTLLPFMGYYDYDFGRQADQIAAMGDELKALDDHIQANGGYFLYVGIPEQHSALRDLYPWYFDNEEEKLAGGEKKFFQKLDEVQVPYLNMREGLCAERERYYSKIDHHFTYEGAYYTYGRIIDALNQAGFGLTPAELEFQALPNPFYGSRNRKLYNHFPTEEKLVIGLPKTPVSYEREDNGAPSSQGFFVYSQDASQPVTYTAYMGGDVGETVIRTNRPELPNILVFGDSFTNPLETMLYLNANEMRSLDLRHYTQKSLYEYIDEWQPDIVICVRDDTNYWIADGNGTFR